MTNIIVAIIAVAGFGTAFLKWRDYARKKKKRKQFEKDRQKIAKSVANGNVGDVWDYISDSL